MTTKLESDTIQASMFAFLIFFIVLSVLVLIHELGHYVVARLSGVKADEFGFGFPPRIIGFTYFQGAWKKVSGKDKSSYPNTIWSINYLPLGGFVRLKGESGDHVEDRDSFLNKNAWKKLAILSAGVIMNWVLAVLIFSGGLMYGIPADLDQAPQGARVRDEHIEISYVLEDSGADEAGLLPGDRIVSINEQTPSSIPQVKMLLKTPEENTPVSFTILRHESRLNIEASSKYIEELSGPGFGVVLARVGTVQLGPFRALSQGVSITANYTYRIITGFGQLITKLLGRQSVESEVAGPIGIAVLTGKIAENGLWALLQFTAILSINLAVINFLPIPALDGGRAVFVIVEGLRRKRNNPKFEATVHQIGFFALMILILLVTIHDVQKYGLTIWKGVLSIVGLS